MARLISAEIEGLAGRKGVLRFDFAQDVNVFWGLNGSGKTSLLKILHSALYMDADVLTRVPFKSASVTFRSDRFRQVYTRTTHRVSIDSREAARRLGAARAMVEQSRLSIEEYQALERQWLQQEGITWLTEPTDPQAGKMAHRYLPTSRFVEVQAASLRASGIEQYSSMSRVLNEATMAELFANQIQQIWDQYSKSALVEIRKAQQDGLAAILSSVLQGGGKRGRQEIGKLDARRAYDLVKGFFEEQRIPLHLGSFESFSSNYEANRLLREVVWEVHDVQRGIDQAQEPQHRIEEMLTDLFSGGKRVTLGVREITVEVAGDTIPISLLSSGEGQLLRIFLECLAAESNIILIDEPELSMHVDWQHRLISCMKVINPNAQIILATHSPEIMAELANSRIIKL